MADAAVDEAKAELREWQIRLKQAQRRLDGNDRQAPRPRTRKATPAESPALRQSQQNLKQVALAVHNYEALNGHLPRVAITDTNGTPLLSWRVALLPYIDEALFRKFHLDEPWDSPHNRALLDEMPEIYQDPRAARPADPGTTYFQAVVGPHTVWPVGGQNLLRWADVTDGTSYTLLVVEAARAVPWTKPEDITYPKASPASDGGLKFPPVPNLGAGSTREFLTAYADGSVQSITLPMEHPANFYALATRSGGEVIDKSRLHVLIPTLPQPTEGTDINMMGSGMGMMPGGGDEAMMGMMSGEAGAMEMGGMMGSAPGAAADMEGMAGMMSGMGSGSMGPPAAGDMSAMAGGSGMEGMGMMAGMMGPGMAAPSPTDANRQRLDALEKKLDQLMKEIEGLRGDRPPTPNGPAVLGAAPLGLKIHADNASIPVGQELDIPIEIRNMSSETLRDVRVQVELSENLEPVMPEASTTSATYDEATHTVTFPPKDLSESVVLQWTLRVRATSPGKGTCKARANVMTDRGADAIDESFTITIRE